MTVLRSLRLLNVTETTKLSSFLFRRTLCQESLHDHSSLELCDSENELTKETDQTVASQDKLDVERKKVIKRLRTNPSLNTDQYENIQNVVALSLNTERLVFLNIDRNLRIHDWNHIDIFEKVPHKPDHVVYFNKLKEVMDVLPEASLYIMENRNEKLQSLSGQYYFSKSLMLKTMFLTMMMNRRSVLTDIDGNDNKREKVNYICMIRYADVSRFFQISVGQERVNVTKTVASILNQEILVDVDIPEHFIQKYSSLEKKHKFGYNDALLLSLAFMKSNLSDNLPHN